MRTQSQDINAHAEAERLKAEAAKAKEAKTAERLKAAAAKAKEERQTRNKRAKDPTLEELIDTEENEEVILPNPDGVNEDTGLMSMEDLAVLEEYHNLDGKELSDDKLQSILKRLKNAMSDLDLNVYTCCVCDLFKKRKFFHLVNLLSTEGKKLIKHMVARLHINRFAVRNDESVEETTECARDVEDRALTVNLDGAILRGDLQSNSEGTTLCGNMEGFILPATKPVVLSNLGVGDLTSSSKGEPLPGNLGGETLPDNFEVVTLPHTLKDGTGPGKLNGDALLLGNLKDYSLPINLIHEFAEIWKTRPELEGLILSINGFLLKQRPPGAEQDNIHVCSACRHSLLSPCKNKTPPKYALANHLFIGICPEPELTPMQNKMMALISTRTEVVVYR
jgi:hypothetical protein